MIILPDVLYGCKMWSLTMREECRLRVFENRALKRIFVPNKNYIMKSLMICTPHQTLFGP